MPRMLKRLMATTVAAVTASVVVATPALAISPKPPFSGSGWIQVQLWSDDRRTMAGYIQVSKVSANRYTVYAEDTNPEGINVTARVDTGDGVGRNVVTTTSSDYSNEWTGPVRKWRLVWGSYSTGWYSPPA